MYLYSIYILICIYSCLHIYIYILYIYLYIFIYTYIYKLYYMLQFFLLCAEYLQMTAAINNHPPNRVRKTKFFPEEKNY